MILDTCFLIDLQREFSRQHVGRASAFLESKRDAVFCISVISLTEFAEGFARPIEGVRLLRSFRRLPVDEQVATKAAEFRRKLRQQGALIGDFDILIGATAVVAGLPLVSDNREHFGRLPELRLVEY